MYNLTRYKVGDKVIVGKETGGYPNLEGEIINKAPRMMKLCFEKNHYFGSAQERWLSANEWYVITRIPNPS